LATSAPHRFGQIIGERVESALHEPLAAIAAKYSMYLDYKHPRDARDGRRKVTWQDSKGNTHDLDYVFEQGGSETALGRPKAFIEIAYRRYTKHSRNKAQEMQGAIIPLGETYSHEHPFLGVVLAGVFTEPSIAQLRSFGFGILYFPFESIVQAFAEVGIDANFDEQATEAAVRKKVQAYERLSTEKRVTISRALQRIHRTDFARFLQQLEESLTRGVAWVRILALHGLPYQATTVDDAIRLISAHDEAAANFPFARYEVDVRYTNGDEIRGMFASKAEAIKFLNGLR
jgi:hypothetical protein